MHFSNGLSSKLIESAPFLKVSLSPSIKTEERKKVWKFSVNYASTMLG